MSKLLSIALMLLTPAVVAADDVTVIFSVGVPEGTPKDAELFVCGNHESLGSWNGTGLKLARRKDGRYHGEVKVPKGTALQFKITRGSWESVEKSARGGEVSNRTLTADADSKVTFDVEAWASAEAAPARPQKPTLTGDIRRHDKFASSTLGNERTILVYLPPGYEKNDKARYPVLYMHDGQNVFDQATSFIGVEWGADETAQRLIKAGRIRPIIIVALYNNENRAMEYGPWPEGTRGGGYGDGYAKFVVEEVKPFIDKTYRTRPGRETTAIAGSSLGGLISLYACKKYPDTFGMCGAMSPALWWSGRRLLSEYERFDVQPGATRFWIDMGTSEGRTHESFRGAIDDTRRLISILDGKGFAPGRDYYYVEDFGAEHNEKAWAARIDKMLLYFFAK